MWPQIWKDRAKLCSGKFFCGDDVIDDVTWWPQSFSLYSCLGEVGSGAKLQGQCLVNKCQYHNCLSRLHMPKNDLNDHSVESPSIVDPQWDICYWGSKWNLHTVCWSAVGCEWGTTSVYFGITYVCFIPVAPQYLLQDFLFLSKVSFEGHIQNLQNISCWFKIWMRFVGPILIKLWTSCIRGFP